MVAGMIRSGVPHGAGAGTAGMAAGMVAGTDPVGAGAGTPHTGAVMPVFMVRVGMVAGMVRAGDTAGVTAGDTPIIITTLTGDPPGMLTPIPDEAPPTAVCEIIRIMYAGVPQEVHNIQTEVGQPLPALQDTAIVRPLPAGAIRIRQEFAWGIRDTAPDREIQPFREGIIRMQGTPVRGPIPDLPEAPTPEALLTEVHLQAGLHQQVLLQEAGRVQGSPGEEARYAVAEADHEVADPVAEEAAVAEEVNSLLPKCITFTKPTKNI